MEIQKLKKITTKTEFVEEELRNYYLSIKSKPVLLLEVKRANMETGSFVLDMNNLVALFVYERYALIEWIDLTILMLPEGGSYTENVAVEYTSVSTKNMRYGYKILELSEVAAADHQKVASIESCSRPSISVPQKRLVVSGLSSVLRFLLKYCSLLGKEIPGAETKRRRRDEMESLLGFRSGCLQACAEASVWTKFCEVDMTQRMILSLVKAMSSGIWPNADWKRELPKDLLRFEHHLAQPVRIHNFRKRVQLEEKLIQLNGIQEKHKHVISSSPHKNNDIGQTGPNQNRLQLSHDYAEGPDITLSDIILLPCVDLAERHFRDVFQSHLPNVHAWYLRVKAVVHETPLELEWLSRNVPTVISHSPNSKLVLPAVRPESLHKIDSSRSHNKPRLRQFTKQEDVEEALGVLASTGIEPMCADFGPEMRALLEPLVEWEALPGLVHPAEGGQLPQKRTRKKCDQLANLVQMVQFVYGQRRRSGSGDESGENGLVPLRIVDFCSGGGHVGILVGWLFPHCHVVLVENKEESVRRAQHRVEKLKLSNISVFQCNLNSFDGHFDIGIALHACGTATDLVLEKCVRSQASFVVCPCCYGAIQSNHVLHYPRSSTFQESGLTLDQYFVLAHSADQTHDDQNEKTSQGRYSMRIIDTDRLLYSQQWGYQTWLGKITPESASPKNHILLGIPAHHSDSD